MYDSRRYRSRRTRTAFVRQRTCFVHLYILMNYATVRLIAKTQKRVVSVACPHPFARTSLPPFASVKTPISFLLCLLRLLAAIPQSGRVTTVRSQNLNKLEQNLNAVTNYNLAGTSHLHRAPISNLNILPIVEARTFEASTP